MAGGVEYSLPFDVAKHQVRISQGSRGPWSHFRHSPTLDLTYAVDFALPFGTEVLAARAGVVLLALLTGKWFYEGLDPEVGNNPGRNFTNQIVIEHKDGTRGYYSHLGGTPVVGGHQMVAAGEVIALSGRSGWVAKIPHIHFQVIDPDTFLSVPVAFVGYPWSLDHQTLLGEGRIWTGE